MAVGDGPSTTPAGWYPDPADPARLRRWDGARWTQDVVMARQPAVPSPPVPQKAAPITGQHAAAGFSAPLDQHNPLEPQHVPSPAAAAHPRAAHAAPQYATSAPVAPPVAAPQFATAPAPAPPFATPPPPAPTPTPTFVAPPAAPASAPRAPVPAPVGVQPPEAPAEPTGPQDWANLPGLTLPPDLSVIPGLGDDEVLPMPRFAEPVRELTQPEPVPGYYPPPPQPAGQYAPPPAGFHYDVPPPPGASYVPNDAPALPPSALPPRFTLPPASAQLPEEGRMTSPLFGTTVVGSRSGSGPSAMGSQSGYVPMARNGEASLGVTVASGTTTVGAWLIGLLPLFHFAVIYVLFVVLAQQVIPGIQWAIILAPAIFSLIFASTDRRSLLNKGHGELPSAVFAFIPPLYLLVRCFKVGIGSVAPLILWVVLQAAAVFGVIFLVPVVRDAIVSSF